MAECCLQWLVCSFEILFVLLLQIRTIKELSWLFKVVWRVSWPGRWIFLRYSPLKKRMTCARTQLPLQKFPACLMRSFKLYVPPILFLTSAKCSKKTCWCSPCIVEIVALFNIRWSCWNLKQIDDWRDIALPKELAKTTRVRTLGASSVVTGFGCEYQALGSTGTHHRPG